MQAVNKMELDLAIRNKDSQTLKTLLNDYVISRYDVNRIASKMCNIGNLEIFKLAEKKGVDLSFDNGDFLTEAVMSQNIELVMYLCQLGVDVNANKSAAIRFSAGKDNSAILSYLIEQGSNIHAQDDCALYWAIEDRKKPNIEILAMAGQLKDSNGKPLDVLSWTQNEEILCLLTALQIDIHVANELHNNKPNIEPKLDDKLFTITELQNSL